MLEMKSENQNDAGDKSWNDVYNSIASGKYNIAHWDEFYTDRAGAPCFLRYALHRSPKKDGCLQLSVMVVCNGKVIPASDSQYGSINDFRRRVIEFNAAMVMFG